ncbi:hypothetical protein [Billgrantia montanilacus]|uniref:hypothetical protein n=1 Tax=Billgrantia montanilacus TaxID=2282305 RepID=UPI001C69A707|nr:hypothetical protein [Halomonas montanilacus]
MREARSSHYGPGAYRVGAIPSMPTSPKKRERFGEDLLPFGNYAGIDPYQQLCEDAEFVQQQDRQDKAFYETDDWWWDHQRIRFLKSQVGFLLMLMAFPFLYFCILVAIPSYLSFVFLSYAQNEGYNSVIPVLAFYAMIGGGWYSQS